ncbi:glycosyltransferase [bacterium]|nr:glycosyltransferase [bacterium]
MKISIITVCKNAESAIERTMLSVVTQSCFVENIEYLIIDGASTDKTIEIIKKYADKYPIKWISEPDSGIYNAMNKGIKIASGDYLLFLNAGDYFVHYNTLGLLVNLLKDSVFDVIYGDLLCVDPKSGEYSIKAVGEALGVNFFFVNTLPHQATFYNKNVFKKFGGYEENFKIISDNIINKKLLCDHKVSTKYVNQIISVFLNDGISSTNKELDLQERKIFQAKYFSEEEIKEIEKQKQREETLRLRKEQKSLLRFLSKIFAKFYELWVTR